MKVRHFSLVRNIKRNLVNWERKREWFVARSITSEQFIVGETSPIEVDLEPVDQTKYRQADYSVNVFP